MLVRRLIVVRHAETSWNRERRYQGQTDIPLSSEGEESVLRLRERFEKKSELYDVKKTAIVSSDLLRAKRTAELLFGIEGREVHCDPALREFNYGVFEGLSRDEIVAKYPAELARWNRDDDEHYAPPGAESRHQVRQRVDTAMTVWLQRLTQPTVVVVTHGGVLRQFLRKVSEHSAGDVYDMPTQINYGNLAVHLIEIRQGMWGYAGNW